MDKQLQNIASNPHYEIAVSKLKNRLYLKVRGFWRSPEEVPNYVSDLRKSAASLQKDFTVLADVSEMKAHPGPVRKVHEEAQTVLIMAGLGRVAEIQADLITNVQLDNLSKDTLMPKRAFNCKVQAEAWLDL